jgi:hypothetical protein
MWAYIYALPLHKNHSTQVEKEIRIPVDPSILSGKTLKCLLFLGGLGSVKR